MPPLATRPAARSPRALWSGLKRILTLCSALVSIYLVTMLERLG